MSCIDFFEKNQVQITGLVMGQARLYRHQDNLATLRISARSLAKTFTENDSRVRKETIHVELHDSAARRACELNAGDVAYLEGQLSLRHWRDRNDMPQVRLVIVVGEDDKVVRIAEAAHDFQEAVRAVS